jgi:peptide/nickel transport system substrate-binding protein
MTALRKRVGLVAVAATAALVLAACSGGGTPQESTSATGGSSATATTAEATGSGLLPDDQQNLVVAPNYGVQGIDITKAPLEIGMNQVVSQVLQTLVNVQGQEVSPELAESWEWTDDTTLVFHLRDDVTFSDGTKFTADDAVASLKRYIEQEQALKTVLAPITSYEATDPLTMTVKTDAPYGPLVGVFGLIYIGQAAHAEDDAYWNAPIGTGPFLFKEFVANDHVSLVRNDNYWGTKATLKTLTFKLMSETSAKITALSTGELQVVGDVPADQVENVKALPNVTFQDADSVSYYFLWFNNSKAPLDNADVRKAMWEALDIPTILSTLYAGTAEPMTSFCPSSAFGCLDPTQGLPKYDPDDAKKLLADAGYPDGFTVDIIFNTASTDFPNLVQAMVGYWKAIGVTVDVRAEDPATWLADLNGKNFFMDTQANQTITGDADYTLNRLYSCAAARLGYCNEDLDAIMTQARASTDKAEREKLYQQTVDTMATDLPAIPLLSLKLNTAAASNVQGLTIPPNDFIDFSTVSLAG